MEITGKDREIWHWRKIAGEDLLKIAGGYLEIDDEGYWLKSLDGEDRW